MICEHCGVFLEDHVIEIHKKICPGLRKKEEKKEGGISLAELYMALIEHTEIGQVIDLEDGGPMLIHGEDDRLHLFDSEEEKGYNAEKEIQMALSRQCRNSRS
jgi:hypothetical protein